MPSCVCAVLCLARGPKFSDRHTQAHHSQARRKRLLFQQRPAQGGAGVFGLWRSRRAACCGCGTSSSSTCPRPSSQQGMRPALQHLQLVQPLPVWRRGSWRWCCTATMIVMLMTRMMMRPRTPQRGVREPAQHFGNILTVNASDGSGNGCGLGEEEPPRASKPCHGTPAPSGGH
jgi:hypothetical protein